MGPPKDSIIVKYFYPLGLAACGTLYVGFTNYYNRRPYFTSIHRHIGWSLVGGLLGIYVDKYFEKKWMERDAIVRHYIELHPEDFVEKKRKYKEIFDEWYPVR